MSLAKLTLSMDEKTKKTAKRLAQERNTSISKMVASFFNDLAKEEKIKMPELTPGVKKALGIVTMPKGKTYRQIIEESIMEKYYGIDE